jgi:hypothetical protein
MRTQLVRAALLTAGGLAILGCWIALGRQAAEGLRGDERYTIPFAAIDCIPPDHFARADFLGEVQYLANLPDRLPVTDTGLAANLAEAFAKHPMVESVERVEVLPRRVRVFMTYRLPVLAIPIRDSWRVVDGRGILLPASVASDGLPRLTGAVADPPAGAPGTRWGDERIEGAARLAAYVRPAFDTVALERIIVDGKEYILLIHKAHLRWGKQPGRESPNEPSAAAKLSLLRKITSRKDGVPDADIDLSQPANAKADR